MCPPQRAERGVLDNTSIPGILIISGYLLGEVAKRLKQPRITGYILSGILLSPDEEDT